MDALQTEFCHFRVLDPLDEFIADSDAGHKILKALYHRLPPFKKFLTLNFQHSIIHTIVEKSTSNFSVPMIFSLLYKKIRTKRNKSAAEDGTQPAGEFQQMLRFR